jgi:uncharacterized protein (TIGR00725 family)
VKLVWDEARARLDRQDGLALDARLLTWHVTGEVISKDAMPVNASEAVRNVIRKAYGKKLPIGVIGPNDATPSEIVMAESIGAAIAGLGLPLICGGRGGCMEAASRGADAAGGLVLGILPTYDWMATNSYVHVPIATGIGEARNAIIASACFALIAVGGGHGTLSEMALGLKLGRLVVAMPDAERVNGAHNCETPGEAIELVARRYLRLDA